MDLVAGPRLHLARIRQAPHWLARTLNFLSQGGQKRPLAMRVQEQSPAASGHPRAIRWHHGFLGLFASRFGTTAPATTRARPRSASAHNERGSHSDAPSMDVFSATCVAPDRVLS